MLWKWIAIGTMTLGMLAGQSSAKACGEKSAQAASSEEAALMAEVQRAQPVSGRGSVRMSQLGSPSLQRSLGLAQGSGGRYRLLDPARALGRSPASSGGVSGEVMQLTLAEVQAISRSRSLQTSPVRLGVNPTSYRLKSYQQEVPWLE